MGYWTAADLPFYHSMAPPSRCATAGSAPPSARPYPNRASCSAARPTASCAPGQLAHRPAPAERHHPRPLDAHGISWANYSTTLPGTAVWVNGITGRGRQPQADRQVLHRLRRGHAPRGVTFVDPDFENASEEDPQNISVGEQFGSRVVDAGDARAAVGQHAAPVDVATSTGLLRPRAAAARYAPTASTRSLPVRRAPPTPPTSTTATASACRLSWSPFARKNYVSHVVHDHTSVLKPSRRSRTCRADLPRRQRRQPARLPRLQGRRVPPATLAAPHVSTCTPARWRPDPGPVRHRHRDCVGCGKGRLGEVRRAQPGAAWRARRPTLADEPSRRRRHARRGLGGPVMASCRGGRGLAGQPGGLAADPRRLQGPDREHSVMLFVLGATMFFDGYDAASCWWR